MRGRATPPPFPLPPPLVDSHGHPSRCAGWWQGSTEVAVKIFATKHEAHGDNLPARALTEPLLARNLAHPNLIRT